MGTATYRIGPSDFFTPGDLQADADTVQGQIDALDAELLGNFATPLDFSDQWSHFENDWKNFYTDHFGGFFSNLFSALNDSNRDDLVRYENQLAAFQTQAAGFGAKLIAPVAPSTGSQDTLGAQLKAQGILPSTTGLILLAVAAIALIVVWKK